MRAPHFFSLVVADPGNDETRPSVARTLAHLEKVLPVFSKSADADARRICVVRAVRRFELKVSVFEILLRFLKGKLRRRCSCSKRRRIRVCFGALASHRKREPNTIDARVLRCLMNSARVLTPLTLRKCICEWWRGMRRLMRRLKCLKLYWLFNLLGTELGKSESETCEK